MWIYHRCPKPIVALVNTLRPRQNGRHFADDTFKYIFLNENVIISAKMSPKFVPKGPIDNIPALVQIMAWCRPGYKPLSEPMMVRLPTHICVTRPQSVNICLVQESPVAILCDVSIFSFSSDQPANVGCHCNSQARLGTSFSIKIPPCQLWNFHYEDINSHGGGLYLETEPSMQVSSWSDTVAVWYLIWYRDRPQWLIDHRLYRINISSNVRWYGM